MFTALRLPDYCSWLNPPRSMIQLLNSIKVEVQGRSKWPQNVRKWFVKNIDIFNNYSTRARWISNDR